MRTRVARRVRSPRRRAPALVGPTTKDALRVETRRRCLLLWLDSLEMLGEPPVVGIAVNGASHGLSNNGQSRLDTPSVRALNSGPQARELLDPGVSHRRQGCPTGRASACIARARRPKQRNRRGGRRAGRPSGIHRPGRGRRAIAPRRTRAVAALSGVANGVSPVPTTTTPHNVLKDLLPGKRRHGLTHLSVQDVLGFAVGRVLQLERIQRVEVTKRPIVQVDEELVLLQGVNPHSNQVAEVLGEHLLTD